MGRGVHIAVVLRIALKQLYKKGPQCQEQILKFSGAVYKKFPTFEQANNFVKEGNDLKQTDIALSCSSPSSASSSWIICKQKLMNLKDTFVNASRDFDCCLADASKADCEQTLLDDFKKTKADITLCTENLSNLIQKIDQYSTNNKKRKAALDEAPADHDKRQKLDVDTDNWIKVFTDGACSNNGRREPQAGIGVYWGPDDPRNISRRLSGRQTNNRAEIQAACEAVKQAREGGIKKLEICTDSKFMITSMTDYIHSWKKKDWQLSAGGPVKNKDDFQRLDSLLDGIQIKWTHVKGHSGIDGNVQADYLATSGAKLPL